MIRPLKETDIPEAQRIVRLAFGTFLGVPDPENFVADMDYVSPRWRADASAAFAAEVDGKLVGSNFATRWGTVGFFGPLTVHPNYWNKGIAQQLMQPVMERFDDWKVTHTGLYTFAESPKHIALYQKYGFYPRFLTAILLKPVARDATARRAWEKFSEIPPHDHHAVLESCYRLTDAVYPGLNVEREIRAVYTQHLGETILLRNDGQLIGFAVCHVGPGTEAGNNKCYIKFAAVGPGPDSAIHFDTLVDSCDAFAASAGVTQLEAGINLARDDAYRRLLARGFRIDRSGVSMHRPLEPGYSRPGVYVIDDWR
ncbi:MAG TPA: GNAT family N-acetyltransferase [Terriglobia bacterium]|nr:GNAT family N-acetyltransferase [Terriglobia bacterium]